MSAPPASASPSPVEQVLAQLGRQKWAADFRDVDALRSLYTEDSHQVIYRHGPHGRTEIARSRSRDEILVGIKAGWDATADTWYPGQLIHLIGSHVIEPVDAERVRCRSYAAILALDTTGASVLKGYAAYDDVWVGDVSTGWLLASRETVLYGHTPTGR